MRIQSKYGVQPLRVKYREQYGLRRMNRRPSCARSGLCAIDISDRCVEEAGPAFAY
jgi:hypothetical protein